MEQFGMLAHHWGGSLEQVQGWEWSRKYNGWSVLWDGGFTRGMLASDVDWYYKGKDKPCYSTGLWSLGRDNKPKVISAPANFLDALPKEVPVHGELWFNDRLDIVKKTVGFKQYFKPMWGNMQFIAFHQKPFHLWSRKEGSKVKMPTEGTVYNHQEVLKMLKKYENNIFNVIETHKINSQEDIDEAKDIARKNSWEGIMFSDPLSNYFLGRSWQNLKWKQVYETEARVIGYSKGKTGKNLGKCGALIMELTWDDKVLSLFGSLPRHKGLTVSFLVSGGIKDDEREWGVVEKKFPIGSELSIQYNGVSVHGVPQHIRLYEGL